jgi:hypothetical protein
VIGGLISFEDEIQKRGVPGLSEVPLMRHLFSWEGRTLQEQEILFVITPRILAEGPDQVAEAIQWRDVEPLPPGSTIELPAADLEHGTNPRPITLGKDGLPPSFTYSAGRKEKATTRAEREVPPPPAPKPIVTAAGSSAVTPVPEKSDPPASEAPAAVKSEVIAQPPQPVAQPSTHLPVSPKPVPQSSPPSAPPQQTATATVPSARKAPPIATANVNTEIRASLTRDYQIEVVVSTHPGDAWSRLSKRITGDASHWHELARLNGLDETLTSEVHIRVPFAMVKPELQQEIITKLIPKGSATESDWKRMSGHP